MMDFNQSQELRSIAKQQRDVATQYSESRKRAGSAKKSLDILLAAELSDIRSEKKNVGIDMAYLMLIEKNIVAQKFYEEWQEEEAKYKGLERIIEAHQSTIMMEMALMKWIQKGEQYGGE